jgi:hypothetical protein|tara:strand:+ start:9 stop:482 length:474 start_codon:yes stop_codon:yes gene_type:complete
MPADTDSAKPVRLQRVHILEKRARLRADPKLDREALLSLANRFASVPNVRRALVRPSTGSVILETFGPVETVLAHVAEEGIAKITQPPKTPPVHQMMQLGVMRMDMDVKKRTGDALDLRTTVGLALLGGAIVQLARGQIAGPATTLALSAISLLDKK